VIVCRYSEIFLKGRNRGWFERRLERNMRAALAGVPGARIERPHGRVLVWADDLAAAVDRLSRVFGLVSVSPAAVVDAELGAIERAAVEGARAEWDRRGRKGTFKVESNRQDKRFPLPSPEISKRVGGAIYEGLHIPVDVHHPDFTVEVEIALGGRAYVFAQRIAGPGGMPVGSAGRVALLLSGGIDSPVAGWMMAKRGAEIIPIYFHSFPFTGDKTKEKVIDLARLVARWHGPMQMFVVGFTDVQKALREAGAAELAVVLYRRMMLRVAEAIAVREHARGLATGDSLGQVASQTLDNLGVIGEVAKLPVLRPLIGFDKSETVALAQRIGTYDLSIAPYEDCCSLFVPKHPATRAKLEDALAAEAKLDIATMTRELAEKAEKIEVRA
jgi:thiamine biosynthesis protein ThiI